MPDPKIEVYRSFLPGKSWVLFANGTCVVASDPASDIRAQAIDILRLHGPVHAGTDTADFNIVDADGLPGKIITCHHPQILAYVAFEEAPPGANELVIGLMGRARRDLDAQELSVVHVEQQKG